MKPRFLATAHTLPRRHFLLGGLATLSGCTSPLFRGQSPDPEPYIEDESTIQLVGDFASPWGLNVMKVESIALVTGLAGTGSDPPPNAQRQRLIDEMQTHDVKGPQKILASLDTSLVLVRGFLPPGATKGARFDIEVVVPTGSETSSLQGGWLMQTRLRPMEVLGGAVQTGHVLALAQGPVFVDALFENGEDSVRETRGLVLGGGAVRESRTLGLAVRGENHSIMTTTLIGTALNARFHTYDHGIKVGVATPKNDRLIELAVPTRYKNNIVRYFYVVRNVALRETPGERLDRMQLLERQLFEPTTAALAALRLEAIGREAVGVLEKGIRSSDAEVRFYSAEALAYLDETTAAEPLAEAAQNEPAFRWHALTALSAMDHLSAYEALAGLLHVTSAETRYGAFHAMRARNPADPLVRGETLAGQFSYHVVTTNGEPMIHFARFRRPEIVVFGHQQRIRPPAALFAGKQIMIKQHGPDQLRVSRFSPGKDDQHEVCSTQVDDLIRTIVKLGGGYADVLQALQDAKKGEYLPGRLVVETIPKPGRTYRREKEKVNEVEPEPPRFTVRNPLPELFQNHTADEQDERLDRDLMMDVYPEDPQSKENFFGKMLGWFAE